MKYACVLNEFVLQFQPQRLSVSKNGIVCVNQTISNVAFVVDTNTNDAWYVNFDVTVRAMTFHPVKDELYIVTMGDESGINSFGRINYRSGKSQILFQTCHSVRSMCYTPEEDILVVTNNGSLALYTEQGTPLWEVYLLFRSPGNLSVDFHNGTGNVALACYNAGVRVKNLHTMAANKNAIDGSTFICNENPDLAYDITKYPETLVNNNGVEPKQFVCLDVAFDNRNQLLICDYYNKEMHVMNVTKREHVETIKSEQFGNVSSVAVVNEQIIAIGSSDYPHSHKLLFIAY